MSLFRVEFNVSTQERIEIAQKAYRLGDDVVVLDADQPAPAGYEEFDTTPQESAE